MPSMTSLERALTTINHGIADRVPTDLHNFLFTLKFASLPMDDALQNGEMLAEAQLLAWREFGHDILLVENGVTCEAQACGCEVDYFVEGPPRVRKHILAESLDKVDELEVPDPFTTHPMCELIKAVRIISQEVGDRVYVMGRADQAPGALAMGLRGYERFLLDLALRENLDAVRKVLDYATKVHVRFCHALREAGAHGTSGGEIGVDIAGPHIYREFANPYNREVVRQVNGPDFHYSLHICGDSSLILEDMVVTGAPILELDYKTDMRRAKALMRGKTTFLGPINPELMWVAKDPAEVDVAAKEAIEILAPGGEFILGPGCALGYSTPEDNIHALIQAAEKYGVYNSDGTLKK